MGFETENFENRICKISYGSGDKKLGILCHLDVVGVNAEKWDTPPFKPIIKAGMIYGKSAHSAGPQNGINAATALLMLLAKIGGPDSVFEKISKRFKHGTFFGEGFGFTAQQTTLSLTGLNFDNNTLEIKTDSKISYTESAERITEKIIAEMPLELSVICMKESHVVSRDLEIVQILQKIYKEQTGRNDEPYDMDAGTYARIAKDAVIFGGVLYGDGGCNAHSKYP